MPSAEAPLPTIDDVATAAGVSTATVSRVLNRPETVSDALRLKVEAAVARLGYMPHAGARALMLRRSGTVGAIFPTVDNAIFAAAITTLQRRLAESGLQLLLATDGYDPDSEMRQAQNLLTCGADALIFCGCGQRPELLQRLRQRGVPSVHVMTWPSPAGLVAVGFDNKGAVGQAVRYLVDMGHRRIAMLAGNTRNNDRATARLEGMREALAAAGLDLPPARLVERDYQLAQARDGLRQLMQARPAPTAIVCGNDVLAFGALLEAQKMGIDVPGQLSIVGFDDLELASHVHPALTTVRVPSETMWRMAAERIVTALRGGEVPPQTRVDVALVVRESTGRAPKVSRARAA